VAKGRRRSFKKPRKRFDWVYRPREYDSEGASVSLNGGYMSGAITLAGGAASASALILYDSQNYTSQSLMMNPATGTRTFINRAGRAEGRGPLIKAVDGYLLVTVSSWAIGSLMDWGWRILVAEQDEDDGGAVLDADYSLLTPPAAVQDANDVAVWANERYNLREGYVRRQSVDQSGPFVMPIRWRGLRRLDPEHALFLYLEQGTAIGTVNAIITPRLRCLVADES